jgi:predicted DNA-binding transcriptional regulator AlpA
MTKPNKDKREPSGPYAGLAEAAQVLGVRKRTVWMYMQRETPATSDFPEPIQYLAATPLWRTSALQKWGKKLPLPVGRPTKKRRKDG